MTAFGLNSEKTRCIKRTSQISPCTNRYRASSAHSANDSIFPAYVNASTLQTRWLVSRIRCRTTAEPIKPHPPVTSIFMMHGQLRDSRGEGPAKALGLVQTKRAAPSGTSRSTNLRFAQCCCTQTSCQTHRCRCSTPVFPADLLPAIRFTKVCESMHNVDGRFNNSMSG